MNRFIFLLLLLACCATAQIETPGSGGTGGSGGGSGTPYYGPFTNLAVYGTSTNFGTNYTFSGYSSNWLYQPVSLSSSASLLVNMLGGSMQVMTLTTNTTISVTNVTTGANVSILLIGPTNNQYNVIMPSYVRLFSGAITNAVTTNKAMIVSLTAFNSNTNDLVATISIQP